MAKKKTKWITKTNRRANNNDFLLKNTKEKLCGRYEPDAGVSLHCVPLPRNVAAIEIYEKSAITVMSLLTWGPCTYTQKRGTAKHKRKKSVFSPYIYVVTLM